MVTGVDDHRHIPGAKMEGCGGSFAGGPFPGVLRGKEVTSRCLCSECYSCCVRLIGLQVILMVVIFFCMDVLALIHKLPLYFMLYSREFSENWF